MTSFGLATLAGGGLAAAAIGLAAPAVAAPSATGSAQDTVRQLEASGYKVILNTVGGASLDHCTVTSVRPGRQITMPVTDSGGDLKNQVLYTTVYVDATC
jgi:NADPH:quinone reductase-like Zn-dependent oxidoreductase